MIMLIQNLTSSSKQQKQKEDNYVDIEPSKLQQAVEKEILKPEKKIKKKSWMMTEILTLIEESGINKGTQKNMN